MPIITRLERQKHDPARVSVFVDDEYAFSLSDRLVFEYNVSVGRDANTLPLKDIVEADQLSCAVTAALKYISAAEKTENQLIKHLSGKGFDEPAVLNAVERCKQLGYIDDAAYAGSFIANSQSTGRIGLIYKLKEKGVAGALIDEAMADYDDEYFTQKALGLIRRQQSRFDKYSGFEKKKRISDFLMRHGYEWDIAASVVSAFCDEE